MNFLKKPAWLRSRIYSAASFSSVSKVIADNGLHTICSSGRCPNQSECWSKGTATLLIAGEICTRSCKFCNTLTGKPKPLDADEPDKVAESIKRMQLKHAVITSVDRDDLADGGAQHWATTIAAIKAQNPETTLEVLIPDFDGRTQCLDLIIAAKPTIISHNLETVKRLTPGIRSKGRYETSLTVLKYLADSGAVTKSGLMVGLGETKDEIVELMQDAKNAGCSILTIGQYMQPARKNIAVVAYIHPEVFAEYKKIALEMGFRRVESGPFVRSSYCAENHVPEGV